MDRYEPLEFLGEGGFAKVFKVKRKKDGKTVALKIPRIDEKTSKTFLREVSTWFQLNHPNVVKLYDADILPVPHLEMEFVEGAEVDGKLVRTLEELPKPVDEKTALGLIKGIAEGLKHAHSKGIVHRDLKPGNILLKANLTPKITDWGLAKIGTMSSGRSVMGYTPLYAAPEHLMPSRFGSTDHRTDVWQLGTIFYELLTGRVPFEGYTYEEVFGKITDENYRHKPPSDFNPALAKYDGLFEKLLAKRKEDRYGSVEEFLEDLEKLRESERRREELESQVDELKKTLTRSVEALKKSRSADETLKNRRLVVETLGRLALAYAELNRKAELLNTLNDLKFYTVQNINDLTKAITIVETLLRENLPVEKDFVERLKVLVHNIKRENEAN
ncbi:serine/threonine protein kinase [Thermococcus eurythermalis]|uniref:Serine/threonine protein kinase n=1 Tax=Thermococcus eurythermalis TaxID=1505907 RepID=A0A097QV13_9EURY|nr:serine/threonine protein kinase [Thermococcus eurythermalis]